MRAGIIVEIIKWALIAYATFIAAMSVVAFGVFVALVK